MERERNRSDNGERERLIRETDQKCSPLLFAGSSAAGDHAVRFYCFRFSFIGDAVCPRPSWRALGSGQECFFGTVHLWRLRFFDEPFDKGVIAVGELVSPLIAVEARREATDIQALFYASIVPVVFPR